MRIAVGADHRGFAIRSKVIELAERLGHEVEDMGTYTSDAVDYPDVASRVAGKVSRGEVDRGILVCGTGLGMCIAANKFHGVRAAPCHDDLTAEMSRRHNDTNVLCLSTPFEGGRHARRVEKITNLERQAELQGDKPQQAPP
jgi:ribose 5-phosphate isomerase B